MWRRRRRSRAVLIFIGVLTLGVTLLLAPCPWPVCRYWSLKIYTIRTLDDYQGFLANEPEFATLHRGRPVTVDCEAVRDDVVRMFSSGNFTASLAGQMPPVQEDVIPLGAIRAWREGRVLHVEINERESRETSDVWAAHLHGLVARQKQDRFAVLPPLFGGVIIHVRGKLQPEVLFSDKPC